MTCPRPYTEDPRLSPVTCRLNSFIFFVSKFRQFLLGQRPAELSMGTVHARVSKTPLNVRAGTLTSVSVFK